MKYYKCYKCNENLSLLDSKLSEIECPNCGNLVELTDENEINYYAEHDKYMNDLLGASPEYKEKTFAEIIKELRTYTIISLCVNAVLVLVIILNIIFGG
jgi:PHP family Zn ribbon phosphoesterase